MTRTARRPAATQELIAEAVGLEARPGAFVAVELELRPVQLDLVALETG